ncbi:MAG: hypothetical protein QOH69_510 [Actinomycetota bacterium]|jgi:hypothetical protein|nr:hypothetical protein [Actinomycetota bacterium]
MNWPVVLDLVNAVALCAGVIFAAYQLVELRRQHRRDAVLGLVRSFQSGDFTAALGRINSLPDGADRATIERVLGPDGQDQVFLVGLTWESLGVLTFRREIDMATIDDFFSGAITISWRKLHTFVEDDRESLERETVWEWFQWLAERMREREHRSAPIPAHVAHRDWSA